MRSDYSKPPSSPVSLLSLLSLSLPVSPFPTFKVSMFLRSTEFNQYHTCDHGFEILHWSLVGCPVGTQLKITTAPSLITPSVPTV